MNTANKLTVLRVLMIPLFLVILYLGFPGSSYVALAIFILASLTDLLDGYVARHYNQITNFGKFMDPLADKILVLSAMAWFVQRGKMPAWVLIVVLAREFAVSGLRLVAVDNGRVIAAGMSGKVKTATTMICLCILFLPVRPWLNWLCVGLIAATTVYSGVTYFLENRDVFTSGR